MKRFMFNSLNLGDEQIIPEFLRVSPITECVQELPFFPPIIMCKFLISV